MQVHDLKVPDVGSEDIELFAWHKGSGDTFEEDDEICDLATDKASFSIEAPGPGKIMEILVKEKSVVKAGQCVAKIQLYS